MTTQQSINTEYDFPLKFISKCTSREILSLLYLTYILQYTETSVVKLADFYELAILCIMLLWTLVSFVTVSDYLADIPPLVVRIPDSYPNVPPEYVMNGYQNNSLLLNIEKYVGKQLTSMNLYSVTQLLHAWVSDGSVVSWCDLFIL